MSHLVKLMKKGIGAKALPRAKGLRGDSVVGGRVVAAFKGGRVPIFLLEGGTGVFFFLRAEPEAY